MLIFLVFLYFLLAIGIASLLCFPMARAALLQSAAHMGARLARWRSVWSLRASLARHRRRQTHAQLAFWWIRQRRTVATALALVALPLVLAGLVWREAPDPPAGSAPVVANSQALALLRGEQLSPPLPLPPLIFSSAEVLALRPALDQANRNWGLLDEDFRQRLLMVFRIMKQTHGYEMALLEGYRSAARQDMLADIGRQVTNARAFQSYHQHGLAADCAFLRDGRLLISEKDPWAMRGYQLYGAVAETYGLSWGGRWRMQDYGHTELRQAGGPAPR